MAGPIIGITTGMETGDSGKISRQILDHGYIEAVERAVSLCSDLLVRQGYTSQATLMIFHHL